MTPLITHDIRSALSEKFAIEMSLTPYSNPKRKREINAVPSAASLTLFEVAHFQSTGGTTQP